MRPLQQDIIEALKVKSHIVAEEEIEASKAFLKDYLKAHPFLQSLVLGISGGQDSTLAGKIAQLAVEELRQETGNDKLRFIAVKLPYGKQLDETDVMDALAFIQPDQTISVNIKEATDAIVSALEENDSEISDFNKGNIKARQRMVVQYAIAGQTSGAVIGTDHAAESVTGFYTKFGDGAADILPLWRLNKGQGKAMLKVLNCPPHLYEKVPTADLEEDRPALPDEVALGVSYQAIDAYLEGKEINENEAQIIERWYVRSEHKRHLPITIYDDFWKQS
ncbi:ammonia-dependent NAD(+) synthetase [Jeotgalibaca arthritidis]|jgi:NAD+ synthase|uniref:NH(3)-dependent NAD(+) synthetase n=1 Tax=Jeotgalibaca arthritidis TaxID=1868794 RepID=A0A6G7KAA8_9LACT|nr:ammonia-dependent NAD(+) synthetase [Jeotgalibaca arthritidis]QII82204.1 ammonia-dependent NAD(+) synthetase [Jeotgalibaca arthritidis]